MYLHKVRQVCCFLCLTLAKSGFLYLIFIISMKFSLTKTSFEFSLNACFGQFYKRLSKQISFFSSSSSYLVYS